jgi:hypothetical protein
MKQRILAGLDGAAPPAELSPPLRALWWLRKGGLDKGPEWERAHKISQSGEGDPGHDWELALVHRIAGDTSNAGYWYRRAGQAPGPGSVEDEWAEMVKALSP